MIKLDGKKTTAAKTGRLPLEGVRIADFSWVGAGSFTTKLFADMGADVIKIESSQRLDSLRGLGPFKDKVRGVNRSGYFADRNTNKRSITINLKSEQGLAMAKEIIAKSDVIANNFSPGTMDRLGVGYEVCKQLNPGIIYIGMSAQGSTGPDSKLIGFGLTLGAISGMHYLTGLPDRPPVGSGTNYPDHIPNPTHAAFAILAALRYKRRTGKGQMIDLSQTEPMGALLGPAIMDAAANNREIARVGNRDQTAAPRGCYPTQGKDRWIAISVRSDAEWQALAGVLGMADADRDRYAKAQARFADQDALDALISGLTRYVDGYALMGALQDAKVAAGVVQNAADVVERDPQLAHRDHFRRLTHPEMGETTYSGQPFKLASTDVGPHRPAPLLGQHNAEICQEHFGLSAEETEKLEQEGVLQ